ncbi:flagellar basal body-associated FliL family protein [Primorskyibacter sp. S87]|uniref:flagellar basal body-associated FliL family protein n=1 Tax=Primorskyibacter sp. S87 TaxID=3415126 RepID=UPI003C7D6F60
MTEAAAPKEKTKPRKKGFILSLLLAAIGAGAGFFLSRSDVMPIGKNQENEYSDRVAAAEQETVPSVEYVPIEPITVSLVGPNGMRQLRFRAQLEVYSGYQDEVEHLLPRVVDLMNGYLRAVEPSNLTDSLALVRLRSQLLRRINIVTGEGRVRDLLVMEFVIG